MAFLDVLGKKITETSQEVVQKTKETAEVLKINSMIADEESQLKNYYIELGKAYYETHKDAPEGEYVALCTSINESLSKIAEYKDQINKIKGIFPCPNCGEPLQAEALFCSACGTKIEKPEEPAPTEPEDTTIKRCTKCGEPIQEGYAFCINCGEKVAQEETVMETPTETTPDETENN